MNPNERSSPRDAASATSRLSTEAAAAVDDFSSVLLTLYRAPFVEAGWQKMLGALGQRLDCNRSVLILRWPGRRDSGVLYIVGEDPTLRARYYDQYFALDPFVNLPDGRAVTLDDFVERAEFERTDYFRQILEPADSVYMVGVDLRLKGRLYVRLRLCRSRQAGNFSRSDTEYVDRVVPHLESVLHLYADVDQFRSERAFYSEAMDQLTLGTIILDEHGRVLHTNRIGERILRRRDGISLRGGQIIFSNHDDSKRFREIASRALEAVRSGSVGVVEVMRVRRDSGVDMSLLIRPSSRRLASGGQLVPSVAVILSQDLAEDENAGEVPAGAIQKLFGLTPKESALAARLASGRTLQEAADDLQISQNTARAHLRAIFAKTGFDRQAKLVRALLRSVAVLGQ